MKVNVNTLVFDEGLYPRHAISRQNVAAIKEAITNGIKLPTIIACNETKKIVDGYHRQIAAIELFGKDAKWDVKFEHFKDDKERLLRAMQLNYHHGCKLTKYDLSHCAVLGERVGLTAEEIAAGIGVRETYFESMTRDRLAKNGGSNILEGKPNPLKRSIRHKANERLTSEQKEANVKLSGWSPRFHAEQLILMIRTDLINQDDEPTMLALQNLRDALAQIEFAVLETQG